MCYIPLVSRAVRNSALYHTMRRNQYKMITIPNENGNTFCFSLTMKLYSFLLISCDIFF